jgi:hypothetical protein
MKSAYLAAIVLAPAILALSLPATCLAQSYGGTGPSQGLGNNGGLGGPSGLPGRHSGGDDDDKDKPKDKPEAPPAAIPGAEPDADAAVVPADRLAAEMSPNDALFDSITRGDLSAAKDALNRGAQLDAHNVLGQTPTDAAIDLNRNDITFLLLSMRGTAPSHGLHATQTAQGPKAAAARDRHGRPIVQVKAQKERAHPVLSADRGTPNPAVGFTGF